MPRHIAAFLLAGLSLGGCATKPPPVIEGRFFQHSSTDGLIRTEIVFPHVGGCRYLANEIASNFYSGTIRCNATSASLPYVTSLTAPYVSSTDRRAPILEASYLERKDCEKTTAEENRRYPSRRVQCLARKDLPADTQSAPSPSGL
ncbi:hypothetical protein GCM10025770_25900 [Viridibacterium curvum]|uniref:Lipoprotein n=1 Tax=Viridibacterium curvum TaxID=1101404 RepID=A0ABP9QUF7_9RHOO